MTQQTDAKSARKTGTQKNVKTEQKSVQNTGTEKNVQKSHGSRTNQKVQANQNDQTDQSVQTDQNDQTNQSVQTDQSVQINQTNDPIISNTKLRDSGCKIIFDDNILYSQFLRDYIDLPCMKDVRPEDIEDVSSQFVPLVAEERNADRVKKVNIHGKAPFFLISLVEHKTQIDYNVCMQIFRYMFLIWDAYEKEAERIHRGISRQKDFCYPPILPIVYYEGKAEWTVPRDFISRITHGQDFAEYLPDFRYYLVPLNNYSNKDLMARKDEISLVMMINKMQTREDIQAFRLLPPGEIEDIVRDTPEHLVNIIADILMTFLLKINVPVTEAESLTEKVREKKMAELFENMEKLDIQAERQNTEEQRKRAEAAEQKAEEAEQRAEAAEQRAETEKQRAETEKQKAETEKQRAEASISLLVESYLEAGMASEAILKRLTEKLGVKEEEVRSILESCQNAAVDSGY